MRATLWLLPAFALSLPCPNSTKRHLVACTTHWPPWADFVDADNLKDGDLVPAERWSGLDRAVMDHVLVRILGLTYDMRYESGPPDGETWTDVARKKSLECDYVGGDWKLTTDRIRTGLRFAPHIGEEDTIIVGSVAGDGSVSDSPG